MKRNSFIFLLTIFILISSPVICQEDNVLNKVVDGLSIAISIDDVPTMHTIWLNYEITNSTDEVVSFPYRYYWEFPVGMSAEVMRKSGKSLVRFGTRHVLADEALTDGLENDRVDLQPGASLQGTVNILDMVILREQYGEAFLKAGKYKVSLSFFGNHSDIMDVQIPRQ